MPRIDELPVTVLESREHLLAAMKDGLSVQLTIAQVLGLIVKADLLGALVADDIIFSGADTIEDVILALPGKFVRHDAAQVLASGPQAQARTNIAALGGALGATDNRLVRSDGTGGVTSQGSAVTLDDSGNMSGIAGITASTLQLTGAVAPAAGQLSALQLNVSNIKFPSTPVLSADANTLDDYEEGGWTPTVNGSATYSVQQGRYQKIGRRVTVTGILGIGAIGTGSATTISGLPFAADNSQDYYAAWVGQWAATAISYTYLAGIILTGTAAIGLYGATGAAVTTVLTSALTSGSVIRFSAMFDTAS